MGAGGGNRETIPVHEVVVLATALGAHPIDLLYQPNQMARYLPEVTVPCYDAIERFTGTPAAPATWADALGRVLDADEVASLLDVVSQIKSSSVTPPATSSGELD